MTKYAIIPPCYLPFSDAIISEIYEKSEKSEIVIVDSQPIHCFQIVCGAGTFNVLVNDNVVGSIDCDYGVMIVVPYSMLSDFALFALSFVGFVFEADEVIVQQIANGDILVNDYLINIASDNVYYNIWIENNKEGIVERNLTMYLILSAEFQEL